MDATLTDIHAGILLTDMVVDVDCPKSKDWRATTSDQDHGEHEDEYMRRAI